MATSRFECVLATLLHEEPSTTPQVLDFTNEASKAKFIPSIELSAVDSGLKGLDMAVKIADYMDNFIIGVANAGFKIRRVIESGEDWMIVEWETGAKWRIGTERNVWARQYVDYPVRAEEDIDDIELPDPEDPSRYEDVEKAIRYVVEKGFFPSCSINGFFSGVWYFLRGPLEVTLKDIYVRRDFYRKLIAKVGEFNLKAEKNLLERGAMMIEWPDDLGHSHGTFISPKLYEDLIFPWHVKAIELAHKYDAFVNMHSHGKIDILIPLLVRARLDMLNPVGPTDNMDLRGLKEKYGDKICFLGGLSKNIGLMSAASLKEHLLDRLRVGSPGSGFILGSEGGIPMEMSIENFNLLLKASRKYRRNSPGGLIKE
ncbi:MAG: uroporphyrinogen decarboxylase family protein [Candidatus Bathyarchaeota archaeon]|nr:uroporphyrinogen decarboxylase family protein [Candidatus Bathyarchaeota archaeon]